MRREQHPLLAQRVPALFPDNPGVRTHDPDDLRGLRSEREPSPRPLPSGMTGHLQDYSAAEGPSTSPRSRRKMPDSRSGDQDYRSYLKSTKDSGHLSASLTVLCPGVMTRFAASLAARGAERLSEDRAAPPSHPTMSAHQKDSRARPSDASPPVRLPFPHDSPATTRVGVAPAASSPATTCPRSSAFADDPGLTGALARPARPGLPSARYAQLLTEPARTPRHRRPSRRSPSARWPG